MKHLIRHLLALFLISSLTTGQVIDSRKIFETLEPSVVLISNAEGGGSGVVLTADGLILTNYHVANTPLSQSIEAIVTENGKTHRMTFDKVTLFKVHAQSDLALLKVEAVGSTFKPAKISKSQNDTIAGGTCFAMGYPFVPGQEKPVLTITKGIISSARRMVNDNPYIQLDAAINPGNSGGALVNDKGVVIGIPTLKFEGADRIGLAAPVAGLKMNEFIDPADKKGNPQEAARLAAMAQSLVFRDAFSFGSDPAAVELAIYLQREALSLEPRNPQWSLNIASMYHRLKKYPLALAYGENAVWLDPNNFYARALLADVQDAVEEPKKAAANRLACFMIPRTANDLDRRKYVIERLADHYVNHQDAARAVYVLSWAQEIIGEEQSVAQRLVLQKAEKLVPAELIAEIMAEKSDHSIADMDSFAARAPAPTPPQESPTTNPADSSSIQPQSTVCVTVTSEVKFKPGVSAQLMDAEPGVVFHKDSGTLEWTPPPFSRVSNAKALFLLTTPDGSEETQVHSIQRK